jgi:hypothetical protein
MQLMENLLAGLYTGMYEAMAPRERWAEGDEGLQWTVNEVARLAGAFGHDDLLAVAKHLKGTSSSVTINSLETWLEAHYFGAHATSGEALKDFAKRMPDTAIGSLYAEMDEMGEAEDFEWETMAKSPIPKAIGLYFVTLDNETDDVFLFWDKQRAS